MSLRASNGHSRPPRPRRRAGQVWRAGGALLLLAAGCRTPRPPPPAPPAAATAAAPATVFRAEVELVNAGQRYVILRTKGLPIAAGEAIVLRGTNQVGRVLITGPARPPRLAADILSGAPRVGDQVRLRPAERAVSNKGEAP